MVYKYAFQGFDKSSMVRANGKDLPISLKKSVELAKFLKGKDLDRTLRILDDVINLRTPVPYTRYCQEMAHQKGKNIDTGGYPVKVAQEFKKLVEQARNNAKEQELGENLKVVNISARKGTGIWRLGRHVGRQAKRAHVEVILGVKDKND